MQFLKKATEIDRKSQIAHEDPGAIVEKVQDRTQWKFFVYAVCAQGHNHE
uniref:Uncharacterized protein n=1 Tax=Arion vulgaris TaxID=1028688 RepID=A0A0B6Z4C9_9EUPU